MCFSSKETNSYPQEREEIERVLFALSHTKEVVDDEGNDITDGTISDECRWIDTWPKKRKAKSNKRT